MGPSFAKTLAMNRFKGTVSRNFRLLVFFRESVSPKPLSIPLGPFRIFSKIRWDIFSSRYKWKKSLIIKVIIILFGHLWEVELTYRYVFAFKLTLRSQQPDIVPIIATGVVIPVVHVVLRISPRILETIQNGSNGILWRWERNWLVKKTRGKNLVTHSFKSDISIDNMSLSVATHLFSYWKIS
jgi:hypothetical protein